MQRRVTRPLILPSRASGSAQLFARQRRYDVVCRPPTAGKQPLICAVKVFVPGRSWPRSAERLTNISEKNGRPTFESNRREEIMKKMSMRPTGHAVDEGFRVHLPLAKNPQNLHRALLFHLL